ncbi:MAG: hypothetical protein LBT26_09545 [Clostridiales Family XIII bacterium]|jgi:hypothetical protein|nr:hypothetical protein [Clostridiales Family XIII bacterium]
MLKRRIAIMMLTILPLSVMICVICGAYHYYGYGEQPVLKISTHTGGTLIFAGPKAYYEVYASGYAKRIEKFDFDVSDVEAYSVEYGELIWSRTREPVEEGAAVEHARRIFALTEAEGRDADVHKIHVGKTYIL